jgi:hypothetical protein
VICCSIFSNFSGFPRSTSMIRQYLFIKEKSKIPNSIKEQMMTYRLGSQRCPAITFACTSFLFWDGGLAVWPGLALVLLGLSDSPASASWEVEILGSCHRTPLNLLLFNDDTNHFVACLPPEFSSYVLCSLTNTIWQSSHISVDRPSTLQLAIHYYHTL